MTKNTKRKAENVENPVGGPDSNEPGGEGVPPPPPPGTALALTPEQAAADASLAATVATRALRPENYRRAMQELATDPEVMPRLDAMMKGKPDPVTGERVWLKPETWLGAWQDVANRGYGRPHQTVDVTSGGEALVSGVVFLPVPVPLPPPDSAGALVIDADAAEKGHVPQAIEGTARAEAEATVRRAIEAGRASGELPR